MPKFKNLSVRGLLGSVLHASVRGLCKLCEELALEMPPKPPREPLEDDYKYDVIYVDIFSNIRTHCLSLALSRSLSLSLSFSLSLSVFLSLSLCFSLPRALCRTHVNIHTPLIISHRIRLGMDGTIATAVIIACFPARLSPARSGQTAPGGRTGA